MSARVVLAQSAAEILWGIQSKADAKALASRLRALETFPKMGSIYQPDYPAALPDHEVLVTYAGNYGIYYVYEEREESVYVEWIRYERSNPRRPFR